MSGSTPGYPTLAQRSIERNIRHWKNREAVAIIPKDQALTKAKVKEWQAAALMTQRTRTRARAPGTPAVLASQH